MRTAQVSPGRLARRVAHATVAAALLLASCGDWLGPGASPEPGAPGARPPLAQAAAARQRQAAVHFGVPEEIRDARGVRFRLVPPATYRRGSPPDEAGREPDEGQHEVQLLVPYYLGATEVTWGEVRAWRPLRAPPREQEGDDAPARGLSHDEVGEFLAWVNAGDPTWFHRLPSEAEWEHACRAGSEQAWCSGEQPPAGVWAGGLGAGPRAVGAGEPNGWGLHDMHGNVAEWCRDWFAPYPDSGVTLPTGPVKGEQRVVRGGSWRQPLARARAAARDQRAPAPGDAEVGVRLLVETGFGVPGLGPYRLRIQTFTGMMGEKGRREAPGVRVRLVSVPERLTARQEDRHIRWRELEGVTPLEIQMLPGRYYLQAWVERDGHVQRGRERKFTIPDDLPLVDVELPPGG
ncbi:MAG: formylglycine-generating enzyme family protein [Planctomycetia bacterium]